MQLGNQASKGAKWTALASGFSALIGVAQLSVVARYLDPADLGTVAIILLVLAVANVFVMVGFADVLVVKHEATVVQLSSMYWLNLFMGLIAYSAVFAGAPLLTYIVDRDSIETMVRVMALTILIGSMVVQFDALMRRELYLKEVAQIRLAAQFAGFIVSIALVMNGFGVWSLIFGGIVLQLVSSGVLFAYAVKYGWLPKFVFNVSEIGEMLRFGIFRIGAALLNTINTKTDQLAIGAFLSTSALGLYTVAYNLAMQPFSRINPVLTQVSFPVFAKIKHDDEKLLFGYRKGLRLLMVINAPLLLGLIAVSPLIIPAFLGPGWESSIPVLQILPLFVLLRSASNINIGLVLAKEKYRWPLYWNLVLVIIIPATIFVAVTMSHSLIVVSWAVVGIQVFLSVMAYMLFARRLLGGFAWGYLSDFGRPVLSASLMAAGVLWVQSQFDFITPWIGLAAMIVLGAILYLLVSIILQRQHTMELIALARAKM